MIARVLIGVARLWQIGPSAILPPSCRYSPSCSAYAIEALRRYGAARGGWLALKRIARCHPWGTHGLDFVPQTLPAATVWWAPWSYGRWRGTNDTVEPPKTIPT